MYKGPHNQKNTAHLCFNIRDHKIALFWEIKQDKCMVILRDLSLLMHCLRRFHIIIPEYPTKPKQYNEPAPSIGYLWPSLWIMIPEYSAKMVFIRPSTFSPARTSGTKRPRKFGSLGARGMDQRDSELCFCSWVFVVQKLGKTEFVWQRYMIILLY